jgi:diaminopimelate dehydrogenase
MAGTTLKIGIVGYGNLGKGVELAISQNPDVELVAVFTRRDPGAIKTTSKVYPIDQIEDFKNQIDVMLLCGGSAQDLPEQVKSIAKVFNTVDSFDTHAKIPEYFDTVDKIAKANGTLALISTGWDPGLFSLARLLGHVVLPQGEDYTFWGKGVSQGHSDAIRRVKGVKNGVQYTVPMDSAIDRVRSGENPQLSTAEKHQRVCYVVADSGADTSAIEHAIKTMPHYFDEYQTTVNFISEEELLANHSAMPHGGMVLRSGVSGAGTKQRLEFNLALGSNPEFTASVLVAYARAVGKLAKGGQKGACTVFDIPFGALSPKSAEDLRKELL